jgi:hypothetical protein
MKLSFILLFFSFLSSILINSSITEEVIFKCSNAIIKLDVPSNYHDTVFHYEEGVIKSYFWGNGDILVIQCGSMSMPPMLSDTSRYQSTNKIFLEDKWHEKGIDLLTKRKWKLIRVVDYRIWVYYIYSSDNIDLFEKIAIKVSKD